MAFDIKFTNVGNVLPLSPDIPNGLIQLGDYSENLIIPIEYWTKEQYEEQWQNALHDICNRPNSSTLIVTAMFDVTYSEYVECWALYRKDDTIFVQNKLLFTSDINYEFDINKLSEYIGERKTVTEEGHLISEWVILKEDISNYLTKKFDTNVPLP